MIKNLKEIETALGLKEGEFKILYDDKDEKEVPLTNLEIIPKSEYETRITNIKKEAGTAAVEVAVKEVRKELGLEFEGKTIKNLTKAFGEKVLADAKIEPDKKVKQLETDLGTMKTNYETEKQRADRIEKEYQQKETARTINSNVISLLPKKTIIPVEEVADLAMRKATAAGIVADIDEKGIVVFKKGDDVLKDKNLVPLKADEVLKPFYESYITPAGGGDGGKDNPAPGKPGSFEAFCIEMGEKNIGQGTKAFNDEMQLRIKNKTLTV